LYLFERDASASPFKSTRLGHFSFTGRKDPAPEAFSVADAFRAFSIRTLAVAKEWNLNRKIMTTIVRERRACFLSTDFIL